MKVIEKLIYKDSIDLLSDFKHFRKLPNYIIRIRDSKHCLYCGSDLQEASVKLNVFEEFEYKNTCPSCNWWRNKIIPNEGIISNIEIGILKKMSLVDDKKIILMDYLRNTFNKIFKMKPTEFEKYVGNILKEIYDCEVLFTGKSHDGGIDLILLDSNYGHIPVQVKKRKKGSKVESVSLIREFRGAMLLKGLNSGIIVTTADHFSDPAIESSIAKSEHSIPQSIDLIDGRLLLTILGVIYA